MQKKQFSVMYDYLYTKTRQKLGRSFTEASQKLRRSLTEASQRLDRSFTEASQKLDRISRPLLNQSTRSKLNQSLLNRVLSKPESFSGAAMQRLFRRTCPVCGRPDLKNIMQYTSFTSSRLIFRGEKTLS